ncbi:hypothetical protein [Virgibacillus sp. CBA3643]|uniref:hypothetical protein n=1 Tax=Virgibacillus sp. CBA3643 TaxID=2942278 RepID=UPI0035A3A9C8
MEILIWMMVVVVLVSLIMGFCSTNKHFKVKEQEIKLEQVSTGQENLTIEIRRNSYSIKGRFEEEEKLPPLLPMVN